jgi:hypothetical protein
LAETRKQRDAILARAEQAEAELAKLQAKYTNDYADWEKAASKAESILAAEHEAALAQRDRMLRKAHTHLTAEGAVVWSFDDWYADLKARAEEGSE